ncbi:MAG: hypothetical protein IJU35_01465 [Paludibacteraceae bacterium]|nr:hypothetical protein [Paludibacteraceae bacterium]
MGIFNTDIKKLAVLLTPTFLRQPLLTAIARILMQPITTIQQTFLTMRDNNLYYLNHNGQVCRLKHALNQLYLEQINNYQHGFQIRDNDPTGQWLVVYDTAANRPLFVNGTTALTIHDTENIIAPTTAFTVVCPQFVSFHGNEPDDKRVTAITERYRLASRTASYQQS